MVVPVGCAAGDGSLTWPRVDAHRRGAILVHMPRSDFEARHRGDGRQRFTAEPQRGYRGKIVGASDLAGGVARHRELELGDGDSAAVVANAREAHATRLDFDFDTLRTGVEAVFNQLLDDGCGALDDLAGSDLIDEVIVEYADRHGRAV